MRLKTFLLIAFLASLVAVTGSDVVARMSINDLPFGEAAAKHLEWISGTAVGFVVLLVPYIAVAFITAEVHKHARSRCSISIFGAALFVMIYFYFQGFHDAQLAIIDGRWTAAALSVGLLPFFTGGPVVLLAVAAGILASNVDRRRIEQAQDE